LHAAVGPIAVGFIIAAPGRVVTDGSDRLGPAAAQVGDSYLGKLPIAIALLGLVKLVGFAKVR
jgi:hypothetical protein